MTAHPDTMMSASNKLIVNEKRLINALLFMIIGTAA